MIRVLSLLGLVGNIRLPSTERSCAVVAETTNWLPAGDQRPEWPSPIVKLIFDVNLPGSPSSISQMKQVQMGRTRRLAHSR